MAIKELDLECTDCVLTDGFIPPCQPDSNGGNDIDIYMISTCDIESIEDGYDNNVITDITLKPTANWHLIKAVPDSVTVNETLNVQTGGYAYAISFQISALGEDTTPAEQAALARKFVQAVSNPYEKFTIVITANHGEGVRYIYGETIRGLRIADGTEFASGETFEDLSGFTLNFSGSGKLARPLAANVALPLA